MVVDTFLFCLFWRMVHKSYTLDFCLEEWLINLLIHAYQYKILLRPFHQEILELSEEQPKPADIKYRRGLLGFHSVQWKSTYSPTFSNFTIKKNRNPFVVKVNQFTTKFKSVFDSHYQMHIRLTRTHFATACVFYYFIKHGLLQFLNPHHRVITTCHFF
jgi:hypothetical protein